MRYYKVEQDKRGWWVWESDNGGMTWFKHHWWRSEGYKTEAGARKSVEFWMTEYPDKDKWWSGGDAMKWWMIESMQWQGPKNTYQKYWAAWSTDQGQTWHRWSAPTRNYKDATIAIDRALDECGGIRVFRHGDRWLDGNGDDIKTEPEILSQEEKARLSEWVKAHPIDPKQDQEREKSMAEKRREFARHLVETGRLRETV